MRSRAEPSTATVRPFASSAPWCASASMPRARPDTISTPAAARSRDRLRAKARPAGVAARAPTTATAATSGRAGDGSPNVQDGGRVVGLLEVGRVVGLVEAQDADAKGLGPAHLRLRPGSGRTVPEGALGRLGDQARTSRDQGGNTAPLAERPHGARSDAGQEGDGQEIERLVHVRLLSGSGASFGLRRAL